MEPKSNQNELMDKIAYGFYLKNKTKETEKIEMKYYGLCKICNDKATGVHYGVMSCEACRTFFKRATTIHKKFSCVKKDCILDKRQSMKCQYCRWYKCLNAGMSLNIGKSFSLKSCISKKIKPIQSFKNSLKDSSEESESSRSEVTQSSLESQTSKLSSNFYCQKYIQSSNQNQVVVFNYLKNKSYEIYREHTREFDPHERRALRLLKSGYQTKQYEFTHDFTNIIKEKDLAFVKSHAESMIKIIRTLPGFHYLGHEDIKSLMDAHFFNILGLRTINLFIKNDYFLMFDEEIQMNRNIFEYLLSNVVMKNVFEFFTSIKSLNLTEYELSLLVPYLLSSTCYNLKNPEIMKEINEYYGRALFHEFNSNKRTVEFMEKFANVVCWAPQLNKLCLDVREK
uniref:Nuclear receptor n=1 Tax=Brachionus calyciflorus TaxID=104777 RepID=A0A221CB13_9BILA|nr:nuclear receptor [Brachionus calyciflorus]